ncbi:hypothetical protein CAPTEDRAFT_222459 [Capitella teleta]|uniref:LRRNT domain-containing protein n=1 Tax=Capitella teleta TaxID=283909 RepID=R7TPG5_CAPTE|nr:hypothetical protein CAPTEDRAFT_222459 [Capitella teleta]|eukprot:ELT95554.1 hypothetical protein CAPTEDRAFT_222459 [Capitella teleta]
MAMLSTMLLLPRILLLLLVATGVWCGCPENCRCSEEDLVVDCSNLDLTEIPDLQLNITSLDLSHNNIEQIGNSLRMKIYTFIAVVMVTNHEYCDETHKHLADLLPSSLTKLDLSFNRISSVDDSAFSSLTSLADLFVLNNRLTELEGILKQLPNLVLLDASHNQISSVPESAFAASIHLAQLKLTNNSLDWFVFQSINQIPSLLKTLDLTENPLQYIPYMSMSNLFGLEFIKMTRCQISTMDSNAFLGLNGLLQLDISGNHITNIKREMFQTLESLAEIDVSDNPLSCDCDTKKFQDLISTKEDFRLTNPAVCFYDNDEIDIEDGDLDFLCSGEGPVPPFLGCFNLSISLSYERLSEAEVSISWKLSNQELESSFKLSHREFGNGESDNERLSSNISSIKLKLKSTGSYVICLRHNECGIEECIDILQTDSALSKDTYIMIAGSCGVALLLIVIILIAVIIARKKPKKEKQKNDVNHNVASQSRVSTVSETTLPYNPYEAIPVERMTFNNHGYLVSDSEDEYRPSYQTRSPAIRITTDSGLSLTDEYLTPVTKTPKQSSGFFSQQSSCPNLTEVDSQKEYHQYEEPKDFTSPSFRPSSSDSRVRVFNRQIRTLGPSDGRAALNFSEIQTWGQNGLFKAHSTEMLRTQQRPLPRTP